jgi:ribosomal protein L11 methyltransferase
VLDLGTGSGILSIAAVRFGAGPILAVDTDSVAVRSAQENCARNGVESMVQVEAGSLERLPAGRQWDLVLVNILAPVILQLFAGGLAERIAPGGKIVLAGIIEEQADEILAALLQQRLDLVERRQIKDWVSLVAHRPE